MQFNTNYSARSSTVTLTFRKEKEKRIDEKVNLAGPWESRVNRTVDGVDSLIFLSLKS